MKKNIYNVAPNGITKNTSFPPAIKLNIPFEKPVFFLKRKT